MVRRAQTTTSDPEIDRALKETSGWLTTNLRQRRADSGLTQQQLAEAVGVYTNYVARLEAADETVNVTLRLVVALAHALGCKPHELIVPAAKPSRRRAGRPGGPRG